MYNLPFSTDQLLKAVDESAKRSRTILIILIFTCFLVLMALMNSLIPKFNWFKSKAELHRLMLTYIIFPDKQNNESEEVDQSLASLSEFIIKNEVNINTNFDNNLCKLIDTIDNYYRLPKILKLRSPIKYTISDPSVDKRIEKYILIGKSINYSISHNIYDKNYLLRLNELYDEKQIEYLDFIRVPILGISFHVNYLGIYSGFIISSLLIIFYFSLMRERINLKITFLRSWMEIKHHHYYLYEYASMLQVLSIPIKLFSSRTKRSYTYDFFSKIAKIFPFITYLTLFLYDFYTIWIGRETNDMMTNITIIMSFIFLGIILYYTKKVIDQWNQMDVLWENQATEFNFEYILESIGIEKEIELKNLVHSSLDENLKGYVINLWHTSLVEFLSSNRKISPNNSYKLLNNFINDCFNIETNGSQIKSSDYASWDMLLKWYYNSGQKNVSHDFRSSLSNAIIKYKKSQTQNNIRKGQ